MRSSLKRRDLFDTVRIERDDCVSNPVLDVETRWSPTFHMIKNFFKVRKMFNTVIHSLHDLEEYLIKEVEWEKAAVICDFLETAASVLSFNMLKRRVSNCVNSEHNLLAPIAQTILRKLESYNVLICSDLTNLAKLFDPRFPTDIVSDSYLLRRYVQVTEQNQQSEQDPVNATKKTLFEQLIEDKSIDINENDKIDNFIRSKSCSNKGSDPLNWSKRKYRSYPNISLHVMDIFAI